jgi:hypothetical protein
MKKTWSLQSFDTFIDTVLGERGYALLLRWSLHAGLLLVLLFLSFCSSHFISRGYFLPRTERRELFAATASRPLLAQREKEKLEKLSHSLDEFSTALSFAKR